MSNDYSFEKACDEIGKQFAELENIEDFIKALDVPEHKAVLSEQGVESYVANWLKRLIRPDDADEQDYDWGLFNLEMFAIAFSRLHQKECRTSHKLFILRFLVLYKDFFGTIPQLVLLAELFRGTNATAIVEYLAEKEGIAKWPWLEICGRWNGMHNNAKLEKGDLPDALVQAAVPVKFTHNEFVELFHTRPTGWYHRLCLLSLLFAGGIR